LQSYTEEEVVKVENIIVLIDFSRFSDNAFYYAMFLAEAYHAKITLLHCIVLFREELVEEKQSKSYEAIIMQNERTRLKKMDKNGGEARKRGIPYKSVILRGFSAADTILDHLVSEQYDLVVMGTHGQTGTRRWLIGSVAEKVVRHSPVPVITIRKQIRKINIKNILIPVDLTTASKEGVRCGIEITKKFNARQHFLYVLTSESNPGNYLSTFGLSVKLNPETKKILKNRIVEFFKINVENAVLAVEEGSVNQCIKHYTEQNGIDLVIMASEGAGAFEYLVLDSTTERVVRTVNCPVLTMHSEYLK
jgi:nucleotide-binding universal stress UspA family protein